MCSRLKDSALLQVGHRFQLWLILNPWPRNFHTLQGQPLKKKKKNLEVIKDVLLKDSMQGCLL